MTTFDGSKEAKHIARGSGKWGNPDVPKLGWTCTAIQDLEEPSAVCQMCETMTIRYVHYMTHPQWTGELGCGCICSGQMESDYTTAKRREGFLKGKLLTWKKRKAEFRDLNKWMILVPGSYPELQWREKGLWVIVRRHRDGWRAVVTYKDREPIIGKKTFQTCEAVVEKVAEYLEKRPPQPDNTLLR